jgi:hypothetical protein
MLTMPAVMNEPQSAEELIEQQKNIALVSNIARFLGRRSPRKLVYTWEQDGLAIVVNDDDRYTIAMYRGEVVCSNLIPPDTFVIGPWWNIVLSLREQIRKGQKAAELNLARQAMIGPLVEV